MPYSTLFPLAYFIITQPVEAPFFFFFKRCLLSVALAVFSQKTLCLCCTKRETTSSAWSANCQLLWLQPCSCYPPTKGNAQHFRCPGTSWIIRGCSSIIKHFKQESCKPFIVYIMFYWETGVSEEAFFTFSLFYFAVVWICWRKGRLPICFAWFEICVSTDCSPWKKAEVCAKC